MEWRPFTAEFKHEAVRLVRAHVETVNQAARDLELHENVLRNWGRDAKQGGTQAFQGRAKQRPDDAEISRLKRELAKTQVERDITKTLPPELTGEHQARELLAVRTSVKDKLGR